jgi:hypothetical protein
LSSKDAASDVSKREIIEVVDCSIDGFNECNKKSFLHATPISQFFKEINVPIGM